MERREFFKWGLGKAASLAVREAEERAKQNARQWIRPPFAQSELDFLIKCTRCGDCIEACPHEVLFPLPPKYGLQAAATPAMDLLNKGCRMCSDWPCVTACKDEALILPKINKNDQGEAQETQLPLLARATIDTSKCLPYLGPECGACAGSCPVPHALEWEGPKPKINPDLCTGCAMCREQCILDPKAISLATLE